MPIFGEEKEYKCPMLHIFVLKALDKEIIAALEEKGIHEPTEIQKQVIPKILDGKNILIISPTGSGKTEAAMLPVMHMIVEEKNRDTGKGIKCIYITPLRALNRDMLLRLNYFGKRLNLKVAVRHGDTSKSERRKQSLNPPDILITTPETFQILFLGKRLRESLKNVDFVVIDEVHELAGDERGAQMSVALERLRNIAEFQVIGLSATVGNPEEVARFLSPVKEVEIVEVKEGRNLNVEIRTPSVLREDIAATMGCDVNYASSLVEMWEEASKHRATLLFVNTRCTAEDIAMRYNIWLKNPPVAVHHGSLSKEHRVSVEEEFKAGKKKMLVCTSSLELGIDVGIVDLALQYNSPRQVTKLVQRIGRAGHSKSEVSHGIIYCDNPVEIWEAGAILSLVKKGWVESVKIRKKPVIVLYNQIVAMANTCSKVSAKFAYDTIKRAYVFNDLTWEEFEEVLQFAKESGKIWYDGMEFGKSRSGLLFFYDNISMIPDEKSYRVVSTANNYIGVLDERFVSSLNIGDTFVIAGKTWRVLSIENDKIVVEYIMDIAMPPSWLGEEIPVPYEIAAEKPSFGEMNAAAVEKLKDFDMWGKEEVRIEKGTGFVFVGIRLGTKGNYTLGLILSSILSQKIGESVEFSVTPYSVALFNPNVLSDDVEFLLKNIKNVRGILNIVARNSRLFKYTFIHIAKKMGVIKKDASVTGGRVDKIVEYYKNTILYREVVEKLEHDYMDIEHVEEFLKDLNAGKIKINKGKLSELARVLLEAKGDMASPIVATRPVLEAVHRRLLEENMIMVCLSCGKSLHIKVKDFTRPVCPFCGSIRVALVKPYEEELVDKLRRGKIKELKKQDLDRLMGISHLLRRHRRMGAMVLAGRGIGLSTAARILSIPYYEELDVVRRVLKEELKYAKNRQFWD